MSEYLVIKYQHITNICKFSKNLSSKISNLCTDIFLRPWPYLFWFRSQSCNILDWNKAWNASPSITEMIQYKFPRTRLFNIRVSNRFWNSHMLCQSSLFSKNPSRIYEFSEETRFTLPTFEPLLWSNSSQMSTFNF